MSLPSRTDNEAKLEFFVGEWSNSGRVLPGPFGPGGPTTGRTGYHWGVGGKWLLYTSCLELPGLGMYEVHGGVSYNSRTGKYDAYAINSLGNLLVYEGEWTDDVTLTFALIHPKSDGARVVYRKLPDGSIGMAAENASADGTFVPYYEIGFFRSRS